MLRFQSVSDLVASGEGVVALFLQVHLCGSLDVAVCKHISELVAISLVKPIPTRIINTVVTQQRPPLGNHTTTSGASFSIKNEK